MNSQGVFYDMPSTGGGQYGPTSAGFNPSAGLTGGTALAPLQVSLFNPSYNKDKFENTALTINGNINDYKIVYAGSYLVRNVSQQTTTPTTRAANGATTTSARVSARATMRPPSAIPRVRCGRIRRS
jgi:hypothetical protein